MTVDSVHCEALFASALQRSEHPGPLEVRAAIQAIVQLLGSSGCAARVAQEFGDHPDTALARMQWAREVVERAFVTAAADIAA
jgi:hypothetical protein